MSIQVLLTDGLRKADTSAGPIDYILPDFRGMIGGTKEFKKVSNDTNAVSVTGFTPLSGIPQPIDGVSSIPSLLLPGFNDSVILRATPEGWVIIGGSGSVVGGGASVPASANVTVGVITAAYVPDTQSSVGTSLQLTIPYTIPGGWTGKGVHAYLEYPDTSAVAPFALDASTPLDASSPVTGDFKPVDEGKIPYGDVDGVVSVVLKGIAPPTETVSVRVYLASYNADVDNSLVRNGLSGATPSAVVSVDPPGTFASGEEFCDNVTGFVNSIAPFYTVNQSSGQQVQEMSLAWDVPSDPRFHGVIIHVRYPDGRDATASGLIVESLANLIFADFPKTSYTALFYALSVDQQGNTNSYIAGVTPSVAVIIDPPPSATGQEYAAPVTGLSAMVSYGKDPNNQEIALFIDTSWTVPADPRFASAVIRIIRTGDFAGDYQLSGPVSAAPGSENASTRSGFTQIPITDESATIYALSVDVNGRQNSYDPATTPSVVVTLPAEVVGSAGQEYCAVVADFSVGDFFYAQDANGQLTLYVDFFWTDSADPQFAGVIFDILRGDSVTYQLTGVVARLTPPGSNSFRAVISRFPIANESVVFFAISSDVNGRHNNYHAGVTPEIPEVLPPPTVGSGGAEYTVEVTGVAASVVYGTSIDGIETYGFIGSWTPPSFTAHPEFGGLKVVAKNNTTGAFSTLGYWGPKDISFKTDQWALIGDQPTWDIYFVSMDVNNHENSLVDGITPKVAGVHPTAQTGGSLVATRLTRLSAEFSTLGSFLAIGVGALADSKIASIAAGKLIAGTIITPGVIYAGTVLASQIAAGDIFAALTLHTPTLIVINGSQTVNIDAFNAVKVSDSTGPYSQITSHAVQCGNVFTSDFINLSVGALQGHSLGINFSLFGSGLSFNGNPAISVSGGNASFNAAGGYIVTAQFRHTNLLTISASPPVTATRKYQVFDAFGNFEGWNYLFPT